MNGETNGSDETINSEQSPSPLYGPEPARLQGNQAGPTCATGTQQEMSAKLNKQSGETGLAPEIKAVDVRIGEALNVKGEEPFAVRVIEDDELSAFEKKTVGYGKWGLVIAALSLLAACIAGFVFFQQFKEMAAQTDLLSRASRQSRKDSAEASITTSKQLADLQAQIIAARNSAKALQGQLVEAHRLADTAARQLELTNRAWIKIEEAKPRGNGPIVPSLSFQDLNATEPSQAKQQAFLNFEIGGKNVGFSTALNIKVIPELLLARWENGYSTKVAAEEKRFCDLRERDSGNFPDTAQAVFPGESFIFTGGVAGAITNEVMNFFNDSPRGPYILPVLIGCVDYQFQTSAGHHHDRFVYEVFHAGEQHTRFFLAGHGVKAV